MKHHRHPRRPFEASAFDGKVYDLGAYRIAMPDRDAEDRDVDDDANLHATSDRLDAIALCKLTAAGFALGLVLTWLIDRLTGGPGLGVMFGL